MERRALRRGHWLQEPAAAHGAPAGAARRLQSSWAASDGSGRSAGLRKIDDPDGMGRCDERRGCRGFNQGCSCECRQFRHRATGAGAGEYAMIASRAAVMVMPMSRVRQQLRREALGADLERERPAVCWHESRSNERAGCERRQHQAGGQSTRELSRRPGSHGCSETTTGARRHRAARAASAQLQNVRFVMKVVRVREAAIVGSRSHEAGFGV